MKNIHEELADLSAWDLPIELRRVFAKYLRTSDQKIITDFIILSLRYSEGKYTDFIRAYMYYELMRRHMLEEMEKLCKKL
ncbi:TPA: hypothetical protein U1C94_000335 [Streptococcus suis]|nr:hypothetical protein [Streptococcus suis]